ncbi:MAG: hypothetical protein QOE22_463 [Candidatus Parcubacteria bacterium]|jgi:hypothetical protein|nr:hypothetical protein [Candidatus Parcubacteria bacterium]
MKLPKFLSNRALGAVLALAVLCFTSGFYSPSAEAAALSGLSDTMSSVKISTASSHIIRFTTPTGVTGAGQTIVITFPSDFNFTSKTIASLTFTHGATTGAESTETLAASPSASAWGAVFSGTQNRILTLTNATDGTGAAAFSAGQKGIITYDSTNSINASTAASHVTTLNVNGDTGNITTTLLTDDTVVVSGTVNQSITFAVNSNSISFGTLDSGNARYANTSTGSGSDVVAHTLAVATNAPSGYSVSVQGATLTSQQNAGNTITANGSTPATSSTGTEQFGIYTTKAGGVNGTIDPTYATGSSFGYDGTAGAAATFATGSSATATETYSLHYIANIAPTTEAGTYTASLNYVATANF